MLSLTIMTSTIISRSGNGPGAVATSSTSIPPDISETDPYAYETASELGGHFGGPERETTITQDIPVIVLAPATVATIHQPVCPEPDVHIILPPLLQLKAISERFTKLALSPSISGSSGSSNATRAMSHAGASSMTTSSSSQHPRLLLSANMHGTLKIAVATSSLKIESRWDGLTNPELDPTQVEGGEAGVREHASTKMKERHGDEGWSCVRVEGRDWGRVLGVGRMGGRVIACEFPPSPPSFPLSHPSCSLLEPYRTRTSAILRRAVSIRIPGNHFRESMTTY